MTTQTTSVLKFTGIRGLIARKMLESVQTTAQLSFFADADATALMAARNAWKAAGQKIGYEDLIIHALSRLLGEFPLFNAHEVDAAIVPQSGIHIAAAISLPGSLVAPCIFDCETKDIPTIASERASLIARAPLNKLTVREMTGGTISISNLGLTRVRYFTPILNRPQTAIIGLGRITPDRQLGISLTVDHRAIDGAPAGAFLTALCEALEANHAEP